MYFSVTQDICKFSFCNDFGVYIFLIFPTVFLLHKMINFNFVVCNILIIPVIFCVDISMSKSKILNTTLPDPLSSNERQVPSEGGSIKPDKLAMTLPKTIGNIPSLDKETGKTSRVHARKGAGDYTEDITKSAEKPTLPIKDDVSLKPNVSLENSKTEQLKISTQKNLSTHKEISTTTNKSSENPSKTVQKPKKPLILNADLLEKAPPEVKSSPGTIVHNQLQSPNNDVKSYIGNANNHPGMVMPIVITILLVPMFAVLGYMALRRGQEAWKNRHYKRMDFLLDGMYND